jgi:hypothetical protein
VRSEPETAMLADQLGPDAAQILDRHHVERRTAP